MDGKWGGVASTGKNGWSSSAHARKQVIGPLHCEAGRREKLHLLQFGFVNGNLFLCGRWAKMGTLAIFGGGMVGANDEISFRGGGGEITLHTSWVRSIQSTIAHFNTFSNSLVQVCFDQACSFEQAKMFEKITAFLGSRWSGFFQDLGNPQRQGLAPQN